MAETTLTDLELPESLANDIIDESTERSKFFASGAVSNLTDDVGVIPTTGKLKMPFWNDLTGNTQVAHNGVNLTVGGVTQGADYAAVLSRAGVWGSEDLAAAFKGKDPIAFIKDRAANWWANQLDRIAVQNVTAAMATTVSGASMASNVLDISGLSGAASIIDDEAMIDAAGLLGDMDDLLSLTIMHSNVRRKLEKLDVVEDFVPSEGQAVKQYRGRTVISHDRLVATAGVYPIIFVGLGAVGFAEGEPKKPTEIERDAKTNGGQEAFFSRRIFTMHPRGIKFAADPAGNTATDAELANAAKWERVWTAKNIRIAVLKAKIA